MSQRSEKYARNMERRVDKLEQAVGQIAAEQTCQRIHISVLEDDLAVYRAAVAERDLREARRKTQEQRQQRREAEATRRKNARTLAMLAVLAALAVVLLALIGCRVSAAERDKQAAAAPSASAAPTVTVCDPVAVLDFLAATTVPEEGEDPMEAEKIEEALLAQGYFSLAVPMPFEYQDYMRTYCAACGCPYPLALAVAEVESHFDMDAVGAAGEVGIMQLNPGPGGSYHAEIQAATGLDPTTPSGNIAGGCYKLGQYMAEFQDAGKAAMAYNMGRAGATEAWAAGITSTDYSDAVLAAMEDWECTVNAWNGQ